MKVCFQIAECSLSYAKIGKKGNKWKYWHAKSIKKEKAR